MSRAPSAAERIEEWLGPAGAAYGIIRPMVDFLANPLDSVTGDPDQLRSKAEAWRSAASDLEGYAETEASARQTVMSHWEGEAAAAFNNELAQVNQSITEMISHFEGTAELLENAAQGVQEAQEMVEDIVRELIVWLIVTILTALAASWFTLGASMAAASAAGALEAAAAGTRAAAVVARLVSILTRISQILLRISQFARTYSLFQIRNVGVGQWLAANFASRGGAELIATKWVLKQPISAGVNAAEDAVTN